MLVLVQEQQPQLWQRMIYRGLSQYLQDTPLLWQEWPYGDYDRYRKSKIVRLVLTNPETNIGDVKLS